jgi:inosine/xanthosine triphosphate pyrophosphatase family protein
MYGAETWTLRVVDQKYLSSFEIWSWGRMEISLTDRVRNEEVLQRVKEDRNILHKIKARKANWICHILCRNCLLKHVTEGKIEGTGTRERKCNNY